LKAATERGQRQQGQGGSAKRERSIDVHAVASLGETEGRLEDGQR
jgi:hypothetical protein